MTSCSTRRASMRRVLLGLCVAGALAVGGCATNKGFNVASQQEPLVKVGMTQQQVLDILGTPTRNMHYRNQPGPTFTYRVLGSYPRMLFDVDFDAQGRVASTSERMDLESDRRFGGGPVVMTARTVHLYVFDGFADWEPAFATAGIANPQFQREPASWTVKTVSARADRHVVSMGGLHVKPELSWQDIDPSDSAMLILPGGQGWDRSVDAPVDVVDAHARAVEAAGRWLEAGVPVAAICGATAGLARAGLLDERRHTSNAAPYLKGTHYTGDASYVDEAAVLDGDLITAGGMSPLEFAARIFERLSIYDEDTLDAWYQLNKTGQSKYFARMAKAAG